VRLPRCWLKSRETAIDSNSETQGFGMCFCSNQVSSKGHKNLDKPAAVAGRKASQLWAAGGLNATEVNV